MKAVADESGLEVDFIDERDGQAEVARDELSSAPKPSCGARATATCSRPT